MGMLDITCIEWIFLQGGIGLKVADLGIVTCDAGVHKVVAYRPALFRGTTKVQKTSLIIFLIRHSYLPVNFSA